MICDLGFMIWKDAAARGWWVVAATPRRRRWKRRPRRLLVGDGASQLRCFAMGGGVREVRGGILD